jgi:hypothetical protein
MIFLIVHIAFSSGSIDPDLPDPHPWFKVTINGNLLQIPAGNADRLTQYDCWSYAW